MKSEVIKNLMDKLNFPSDAKNELLSTLDALLKKDEFFEIVSRYDAESFDFLQSVTDVKLLAEKENLCSYTVCMLHILCMAPKLLERYINNGLSETLFYNTMVDLRYKLEECCLIHNKVGTFVSNWYKGFFEMRIFSLGRLQFEINHTWFDCNVGGKCIPKGTKVLSVHIPRDGTPLNHELVVQSYKNAKEFFKDEFNDEIIFICNSWLLDPWNRTVLKEESNLAKFYDDFTIVETGEYKDYSETWRLFDCLYNENLDSLPCDTSLRRAYIERMKAKMPTGYATGIILNI